MRPTRKGQNLGSSEARGLVAGGGDTWSCFLVGRGIHSVMGTPPCRSLCCGTDTPPLSIRPWYQHYCPSKRPQQCSQTATLPSMGPRQLPGEMPASPASLCPRQWVALDGAILVASTCPGVGLALSPKVERREGSRPSQPPHSGLPEGLLAAAGTHLPGLWRATDGILCHCLRGEKMARL